MIEVESYSMIEEKLRGAGPFAVFRLPGEDSYHVSGEDGYMLTLNTFNQKSVSGKQVLPGPTVFTSEIIPETTDSAKYLAAVATLSAMHKEGGKTVLSRIIGGTSATEDILQKALNYFALNANTFCAIIKTSPTCLWVMATPELLLKEYNDSFETYALAGTRLKGSSDEPWDEKNKTEQRIVNDYIEQHFGKIGLTDRTSRISTLQTSNVEHILTQIKAQKPIGTPQRTFEEVLDEIAPTPAVCGFPMNVALRNIAEFEAHPRGLYSGYVTVTHPDGLKEAYVTLRCAQIDVETGRFAIYVGGGITGDSDPEAELRETEMKAKPLLDILNPFKNNQPKVNIPPQKI